MDFLSIKHMLDRVQVYVQGAANPVIERAILDAAREFCINSEVHNEQAYPRQIYPNVINYEFDSGYNHLDVVRLDAVTQHGTARRNVFTLSQQQESGMIHARLIFAPNPKAKELWEPLITEYHNALEAGALSKLYRQRGAEFFSPELAREERLRFQDEIHNAKAKPKGVVRMRGKSWAA